MQIGSWWGDGTDPEGAGPKKPLSQRPDELASGSASRGHDDGGDALEGADASHAVERALREELRGEVGRLLRARQLLSPGTEETEQIRGLIRVRVAAYQRNAANTNTPLLADPRGTEQRLFDSLLGMGPLQPFMDDPRIEEVICNGHDRVFVVEDGKKRRIEATLFDGDAELYALVKRLIGPLGRRLDDASPLVDARLPDGSRLNAVVPPVSSVGCCVTIRKFVLRAQTLQELVQLGTLPLSAAQFLEAAVRAGVNFLVSGPAGSGKTTLLNALGAAIASLEERIVAVEEVAELQLSRLPDCIGLQVRVANAEGIGEIRIRDLVRNALRMRPTRILVGECRGPEALDVLMAMNTGHDGSLTTIHGNSPRDALDRLTTLAMMAEERLGSDALVRMIARTVGLVLQLRLEPRTGRRRLVSIFEVTGMEGNVVAGNELWRLTPDGSHLAWTGVRPRCLERIQARGVPYALPVLSDPSEPTGEVAGG